MTEVQRGTARMEGVIEVDVDNVWALVTDWGNMDWWANGLEQKDMQAARTYLEGEKGKVPRTKVIERRNAGSANPDVVHVNREVLIHEDPVVHRLYYNATDGLLPGLRNYLATWTLDALDGGRCRMQISSNFDVTEPGGLDYVRDTLEAVYVLIIKGLNDYLLERGGKYAPAD